MAGFAVALLGASAIAGNCTWTFDSLRNAGAADLAVPIALEEGANGFTYSGFAEADGSDLRIADTDGSTQLPYEIESWNPSGRTIVWVRVPAFSKDTVLHLSWGDAGAPGASGSAWADSKLVMHFTGATPQDSSPSAVTFTNFTEAQELIDGILGDARKFFGTPTKARIYCKATDKTVFAGGYSTFTYAFWWKADVLPASANQYVFQLGKGSPEMTVYVTGGNLGLYSQGHVGTQLTNSDHCRIPITDTAWHHYAFTYDGATLISYRDGAEVCRKSQTWSMPAWTSSREITFGSSSTPGAPSTGSMDEFRYEEICRGAEYIRALCETQARLRPGFEGVKVSFADCATETALEGFPAFVTVSANDKGCGNRGELVSLIATGDAEVVSADGSVRYPFEVEWAYPDGINAAGLWVKVPSFGRTTELVVRGKANFYVPDAETQTADGVVWDDSCLMIHHLGPQGTRVDSANGVALKARNANKPSTDWSFYSPAIDGPSGPCQALNGGTTTVACEPSATIAGGSLTNVYTISWWAREEDFDNPASTVYVMFVNSGTDKNQKAVLIGNGQGKHTLSWYPYPPAGCGIQVPDAGWHHYAWVSDGQRMLGYVDGVQKSSSVPFDFMMPEFTAKQVAIGNSAGGAQVGTAGFTGGLDEVRFETVARSADWIAASYANQLAYRDGCRYSRTPELSAGVKVVETAGKLRFTAALSCRTDASGYFCYGSSDGGNRRGDWEHVVALGPVTDGEIACELSGLLPDTAFYGRFFAENAHGASASGVVRGRTAIDRLKSYAQVTVSYDESGELADFPVAITFPRSTGLPKSAKTLRILDADGHSLAYEVETWNPSADSVIWVTLPHLSGSVVLTVAWRHDAGDEGDLWLPGNLWGDAYRRVYHFGPSFADSSTAGDDLVTHAAGTVVAGKVGGALAFSSGAGTVSGELPKAFNDFADGFTVSLWAKVSARGAQRLSSVGNGGYAFTVDYDANADGCLTLGLSGFNLTPSGGAVFDSSVGTARFTELSAIPCEDGEWHHYAWSSDGRWFRTYRDGVELAKSHLPMTPGSAIAAVRNMVASFGGDGATRFGGLIDEFRVESCPRSAAWIAAAHANQSGRMVSIAPTVREGLMMLFR